MPGLGYKQTKPEPLRYVCLWGHIGSGYIGLKKRLVNRCYRSTCDIPRAMRQATNDENKKKT